MRDVAQLQALSELFAEALEFCRPRSVAVLGVAGGNGLEHIDPEVTGRVAGIDINRGYLDAAALRYRDLAGLELHCLDLAAETVSLAPVELVHAALIFEHAGTERCLENALALVEPRGHLSVVLQEPGEWERGGRGNRFDSIRALRERYTLYEPAGFPERVGLAPVRARRCAVPGGWLWHGMFRK